MYNITQPRCFYRCQLVTLEDHRIHVALRFEPMLTSRPVWSFGCVPMSPIIGCQFKEDPPFIVDADEDLMKPYEPFRIWIPSYSSLPVACQIGTAVWKISVEDKTTHQSIILAFSNPMRYSEPVQNSFGYSTYGMPRDATLSHAPLLTANSAAFKAGYHAPPRVLMHDCKKGQNHYLDFSEPYPHYGVCLSLHNHSFQHCLLQRLNWQPYLSA